MNVFACVCVDGCGCVFVCVLFLFARFCERCVFVVKLTCDSRVRVQVAAAKSSVRSELREVTYASLTFISNLSEAGHFGQVSTVQAVGLLGFAGVSLV